MRKSSGEISFTSAYEKGSLMETATNKIRTTADFATWTGEATFDIPEKQFRASAMRGFSHVDEERTLKIGSRHKWATIFKVKD